MRIRATVSAFLFLSSVLLSSPAFAQQRHVVSPADMRQAITQQAQAQQQTRDSLRAVLKNSQVRDVANRLGLNVARAEGAVATLTAAELEQLAGPVRDLNANVLFVVGDRDIASVQNGAEASAARIKKAKVVTIKDADHLLHMEKPAEINKLLVEYISLNGC